MAWLALLCCWAPAALAVIKIDIPDVPRPVEDNIRAFLSLTRYAERTDLTQETMGRLLRRVVSETRDALEPLGYYEPKVEYGAEHKGDDWIVTILVTTGRPVRISDVSIDVSGLGQDEPALRSIIVAGERDLKPGLRLNHGTYDTVKASLLRAAKNQGYIDARYVTSDLAIDRVERRATINLLLETGERYRYGEITIEQDVINDDAMRRLLRMKPGEPYTLDSLLRTQYVLDDSMYFASVDIDSGEPESATHTVPVTIRADPNRKQRYAASFGYATDTKARGKITWDNRLVNRQGHRSKVEATGSSVLQELSLRYAIPVRDIALEKLEFTGAAREEELGDTLSQQYEFGTGLTQVSGSWQRSWFVKLSNETTTLPPTDEIPTKTRNTQFLIIPGVSFATLPSYVVGDQLRPYSLFAELRGSPSSFGSDSSFLQLRFNAEGQIKLSDLWSLRLRGELGASWVGDFSVLPASQRFFAGGDRSVRGFALNSLSPKEEGKSIGGENLLTGSIEIERKLPRDFGVAAFFDVGNAFQHFGDPLESAAGLGVRYHIAVASLGVDVAQPLSVSGSPRLHLYISTLF